MKAKALYDAGYEQDPIPFGRRQKTIEISYNPTVNLTEIFELSGSTRAAGSNMTNLIAVTSSWRRTLSGN
jgi:hypothetical protein